MCFGLRWWCMYVLGLQMAYCLYVFGLHVNECVCVGESVWLYSPSSDRSVIGFKQINILTVRVSQNKNCSLKHADPTTCSHVLSFSFEYFIYFSLHLPLCSDEYIYLVYLTYHFVSDASCLHIRLQITDCIHLFL